MREGGGEVETSEESVGRKRRVEPDIPEEEEEDNFACEVCRNGDREHLLLLCDSCDLGNYLSCEFTELF